MNIKACLHGGGGPQVGEVTRLAVVEKQNAFTCNLTTPGCWGVVALAIKEFKQRRPKLTSRKRRKRHALCYAVFGFTRNR